MSTTNRAYTPKDIENSTIKSKIKDINKNFPFQEHAVTALFRNILAGKNTILYGKGGYGKSQLSKAVCKALGLNSVIIQCYSDMPKDALIGPPNYKKFIEESIFQTNFEESHFMTPGVLILEEFMDAEEEITSILKDIIQEKGYRHGNKFIPHNIQAIIAIGNKDPKDVAISVSSQALYLDRFISHINMEWEDHLPENYQILFKTKYKITDTLMLTAAICSEAKVSPRIALDIAEMVLLYGIDYLSQAHHLNHLNLEELMFMYYED